MNIPYIKCNYALMGKQIIYYIIHIYMYACFIILLVNLK